jgi:hypothetical protein
MLAHQILLFFMKLLMPGYQWAIGAALILGLGFYLLLSRRSPKPKDD